ncbi:lytic murein transglycosylase B [soil metagenome]
MTQLNFSPRLLRTAVLSLLVLALAPNQYAISKDSPKKSARERTVAASRGDPGEFVNFAEWGDARTFMDDMVNRHAFNRVELESILRKTRFVASAVQLMKPAPPDRPKNWRAYRARFVEPTRINAGAAFWDQYADALANAETKYGVPAEIIVGILGVETMYGRNVGDFRVMDAVATLAFAYPDTPTRAARMEYFRGELANTLLFARESGIDPFTLRGSYAGAIGWPQFMPGSIRKFAVDFDGDSKIDLRNSPTDAIGSIGNFLVQHGWQRGEELVFPATIAGSEQGGEVAAWKGFIGQGLEAKFKLDELKVAGIIPGAQTPPDMMFGLVDLQNGSEPTEYWLGASNFFAITQYNRSFFYAMSVIDLGRAVKTARTRLARKQ